jgi:Lysine methyltransferase
MADDTTTPHQETAEKIGEYSDDDDDDDDDDEDYPTWIRSIRSKTGLEIAIEIDWPDTSCSESTTAKVAKKLNLSTCLEPDDIAPMFNGTQWAGTRVWRSSIVATQYLLQEYGDKMESMLELGAGLGVPGMMMHALRGWRVVLTDKDPLPKQLAANCKANFGDDGADGKKSKSIRACELDWSRQGVHELMMAQKRSPLLGDSSQQSDFFGVVLNCDCVYEPLYGLSWKLLVETMDELLRINPATIMITSLERRKADGVDKFLEALNQSDHVSRVHRLDFDSGYPDVQLYRIHGCT